MGSVRYTCNNYIITVTKEKDCHNLFSQIPCIYCALFNMHLQVPSTF